LCLLFSLAISVGSGAQQPIPVHSKISSALGRMKNKALSAREEAFADLMSHMSEGQPQLSSSRTDVFSSFCAIHPEEADRVKLGLIQLLTLEDDTFVKGKPGSLTEGDVEYYAEVIETVSSLNDERAIPALEGAITTGGMAQHGLLKHGDKALGSLLVQLKSPDDMVRASALGMSIALLEKRGDHASQSQIRELIRSSLTDPDMIVRRAAVQQIECIDDRQNFVPVLKEIAKTDPQKLPGKALDGGDGDEFYPVRYDARRALRDIRENRTCTQ
jgi:hypothetical protein